MWQFLDDYLVGFGFSQSFLFLSHLVMSLLVVAVSALFSYWIARRYLVGIFARIARQTRAQWDDVFVGNHFPQRVAALVPMVLIYLGVDLVLVDFPGAAEIGRRAALVVFVVAGVRVLATVLQSVQDIYYSSQRAADWPVRSYLDAVKIIIYILAAVFIAAIITDKSPWGIISVFGGLTAILLLIFRDTILGLVANLQLMANDMVRVGDWIEMPKHGADGDVMDISLHTVKVQNWDKTITTIPTHDLVNHAFKNWRGMAESGGRRIKRSIYIDISSISFCSEDMLIALEKYPLLQGYLAGKEKEIDHFNETMADDPTTIGERRQTNVGVFRAYIKAYLHNNPLISKDLTFLVRHLAPTAQGLPIEIYVFSTDKVWANYEGIQADIFDHILAIAPEFGLRIFQYPSSHDLLGMVQAN